MTAGSRNKDSLWLMAGLFFLVHDLVRVIGRSLPRGNRRTKFAVQIEDRRPRRYTGDGKQQGAWVRMDGEDGYGLGRSSTALPASQDSGSLPHQEHRAQG